MSHEKTRTRAVDKLINRRLREVRTATIGKVLAVAPNGYVDVDPQIQLVRRDPITLEETPLDIGRLNGVPIGYYKAGGMVLTLPTDVGDEGLLIISDRSLDLWKVTGNKNPPNGPRLHDFSDAVFIPFPTSAGGAFQSYNADAFVVGKEDLTAFISINKTDGAIVCHSDLSVTCTAPTVAVNADNLNISGDSGSDSTVAITGTLSATGVIHSDSNVEGADFVPASGPTYNNHGHEQGNDSRGDSQVKTGTPS